MDTTSGDDEAPKDPGIEQTHYQSFSEKDFEGEYEHWYESACSCPYIYRIPSRNILSLEY
jgi:hypothetical protein